MPPRPHITQPAPSPLQASTHTHHRLFLGPLPKDSGRVNKANTARVKRYRALLDSKSRRTSSHDDDDDAGLVQESQMGALGRIPGLRRRRRSSASEALAAGASTTAPFFIIGDEFRSAGKIDEHGTGSTPPIVLINPGILDSGATTPEESDVSHREAPKPVSRPSIYPRSTMDRASFQTARDTPMDAPNIGASGRASRSVVTPGTPFTARTGTTDFFSAKSTISPVDDTVTPFPGDDDDFADAEDPDAASNKAILDGPSPMTLSPTQLEEPATSARFRTKLRSALRKKGTPPTALDTATPPVSGPSPDAYKGKKRTVQFPNEATVRGPASPREVLARTGSAVKGTSAGVVEAARLKKTKDAKADACFSSNVIPESEDSGENVTVGEEDDDEGGSIHLRGE